MFFSLRETIIKAVERSPKSQRLPLELGRVMERAVCGNKGRIEATDKSKVVQPPDNMMYVCRVVLQLVVVVE